MHRRKTRKYRTRAAKLPACTPAVVVNSIAIRVKRMYFGGIGMESNRSLSFASYNCACVIKTLPSMESASAIVPAMAKYSHVSPISHSGTSAANTTNIKISIHTTMNSIRKTSHPPEVFLPLPFFMRAANCFHCSFQRDLNMQPPPFSPCGLPALRRPAPKNRRRARCPWCRVQ